MWGRFSTCGRFSIGPDATAPKVAPPVFAEVSAHRIELSGFTVRRATSPPQVEKRPHRFCRILAPGEDYAALGNRAATLGAVLLLAALPSLLTAEIVDRIAVSVGNAVITTSDLDRQIRLSAFLSGTTPVFTAAAKRQMADRMVEQALIRKELESSRYPVPTLQEIEPEYQAFRARHYPDPAVFAQALQKAGITEQDLKQELVWQQAFTQFLDVRFRPGAQVTDADIEKYFNDVVAPLARQAHPGQPVNLADYRHEIEAKLSGDRANDEMDRWLTEVKRRTQIVFHDEAFR